MRSIIRPVQFLVNYFKCTGKERASYTELGNAKRLLEATCRSIAYVQFDREALEKMFYYEGALFSESDCGDYILCNTEALQGKSLAAYNYGLPNMVGEEFSRLFLTEGNDGGEKVILLNDHCANCSKKDVVLKPAYKYEYEGEVYQAYLCQYCRANLTKWKNKLKEQSCTS